MFSRLRTIVCSLVLTGSIATAAFADVPTLAPGTSRLVVSWSSIAGPLNPHLYNPNQMYAQRMVYDPLVFYRSDGTIGPALAQSWEISSDGKRYTFHLQPNVKFSDGSPLTAHVVAKNFDAVMNNAERHGWLELIRQIQSWKALDDHTFEILLKHPYDPMLNELSLIRPLRILGEAGFPNDGDTSKGIKAPIGTGPWMLAESRKGEYDLFRANPYWWGGKQAFDEVLVRIISDPTARALAFDTGEIDVIYGLGQIEMETFKRYQKTPGVTAQLSGAVRGRSIVLNSAQGPTSDQKVRAALWHGINRPAILKHVFLDLEIPAETLMSPYAPYCDLSLKPRLYDVDKAAQLLDESGWKLEKGDTFRKKDGQSLSIQFSFIGNDALQKASAEAIQGDLRAIGVDVRLVPEEEDSYYKRQKTGEFDMIFSLTWGAPYDPPSYMSSMRKPSHADYQAQKGLSQKEELDRRITQVLVETEKEKRKAEYAWILSILHEEAIYIPLSFTTSMMVFRDAFMTDMPFGALAEDIPFEHIKKH